MRRPRLTQTSPRARRLLLAGTTTLVFAAAFPAAGLAALSTFGSSLAQPATLNTVDNLAYAGVNIAVPPSPQAPSGNVHVAHFGADTALWNASVAGGQAAAPEGGQAVKLALEGCAQPAPGGPAPLTQIHFQDLSPQPGGGAKVNISSQAFTIPVCGRGGASGATVSTYEPINLCVSQGDYVALNDEGGYVPGAYPSGVPYQVMGAVGGSAMDSFIRNNGVGNGALLSAGETGPSDGFAANPGEELMLQVTLGTGPDARYVCPGGSKDKAPTLRPAKIIGQTYHVSKTRLVKLGLYCRGPEPCTGEVGLGPAGQPGGFAHSHVELPGGHTSNVTLHVTPALVALIHKHHHVDAVVTLTLPGGVVTQAVTLKVF
jgi:hypothetical protein